MNGSWRVGLGVGLLSLTGLTGTAQDAVAPSAVRPLTEGPLHEAFLSPARDREPVRVPKSPPAAINERPGIDPPEADAEWIEGYWQWSERRDDFVWVTGTWRVSPPGRFWVNGYWKRDDQGWFRVTGFWSDRQTDRLDYRKQGPPADHPEDDPGPAPSEQHFYVPGHYQPDGDGVAWKPGYWARAQEGWSWVPAQWVKQPEGWVYQEGYWDWTLDDRGIVFTPAQVDTSADTSNVVYQPLSQVDPDSYARLYGAFGRPTTFYDGYPGCYYDPNGNYYGYANYGSIGLYQGYLDYPFVGSLGYPYLNYVSPTYAAAYPFYGYSSFGTGFGFGLGRGLVSTLGFGLGFATPFYGYGFGSPWFGTSLVSIGWGNPFWGWGGGGWGGGHRNHHGKNYPHYPGGSGQPGRGRGGNWANRGGTGGNNGPGRNPGVNIPNRARPIAGPGRLNPGGPGNRDALAGRPRNTQVGGPPTAGGGRRGPAVAPASTAYANPFRGQTPNATRSNTRSDRPVTARPSGPLAAGNTPGFNGVPRENTRPNPRGNTGVAAGGVRRPAQTNMPSGRTVMRPTPSNANPLGRPGQGQRPGSLGAVDATGLRPNGGNGAAGLGNQVGASRGTLSPRGQPFDGNRFPYNPPLNVGQPQGARAGGNRVQFSPPSNVSQPGAGRVDGPAFQYSPPINVGQPGGARVDGSPGGMGPQSRLNSPSPGGRGGAGGAVPGRGAGPGLGSGPRMGGATPTRSPGPQMGSLPGMGASGPRIGASPSLSGGGSRMGMSPSMSGGGMRMGASPSLGGGGRMGGAPGMGMSGGRMGGGGVSGGGSRMGGGGGGGRAGGGMGGGSGGGGGGGGRR